MNGTPLAPELALHVEKLLAALPGGSPAAPPLAPRVGQTRAEWLADVAAARAEHDAYAGLVAAHRAVGSRDVAGVHDHAVPIAGGTITARVYTPEGAGPFPGMAFYHGGAWWQAGGEQGFALTDDFCRAMCAGAGAVVVNVDYRLAPEFPFPHQLEDAYAGLCWLVDNAGTLDIEPPVSVMGASSGANLAAAVSLLARDRGGPTIRAQILQVPALDLTGGSPSMHEDPEIWEQLSPLLNLYTTPEQRSDPLASPLLARDLSGLPAAVIVVATHDPLRDDGHRYAARLAEHGVDVRLLEYPMLHDIALPETLERVLADMIVAVQDVHAGRPLAITG